MADECNTQHENKKISAVIKTIRTLPGNELCADCNKCNCPQCSVKSEPNWISEELQIIVCSECKTIHERVTETAFRSLQVPSDWTLESIKKVSHISNSATNEIYEHDLPVAFRKPTKCFDWRFREHWIKSKYKKKDFRERKNLPRYLWGTKTGYLWKRGRDDSLFMRRWFVLDIENNPVLKYYSDANEEQLKGEIPLMSLDLCLTSEEKMEHPNAMQIFCKEGRGMVPRVIYLYSETPKDLVEWYQTIRIRKSLQLSKEEPHLSDSMQLKRLGKDILHEGYLWKTGKSGRETFRRRWFVLHGRELHYFKDPLDANPKGTVSLETDGISVILSGQKDKLGFHFKLKTPQRLFPLIAEDEQQRELWIKAIHQSCYEEDIVSHKSNGKASTLPVRLTHDPTEIPPQVPLRNNKSLPLPPSSSTPLSEGSNSDSDCMEEMLGLNYVYLENGRILAHEDWEPQKGMMVKGEVLMLKIPPHGLEFTSGSGDITVTVQKIDLMEIANSKLFGDVAFTVKCQGSPSFPAVTAPMEIELYHCAILASTENLKSLLWIEEASTWKQVLSSDERFKCKISENTFNISSKFFGGMVASVDGANVLGKRMRCAAFCKFEENSKNLEIIVYIFNNHVSDFMWKMIEMNETSRMGTKLVDISKEFSLLKENKGLLLSIETIEGLQLMPGNFTTLSIPFDEVWSKSYVSYHIELIQSAKTGHCQLVVSQEIPVNGGNSAVLNLTHSTEIEFEDTQPQPGKLERHPTPHAAHNLRIPPVPTRHSSDSAAAQNLKQMVETPHFHSQKGKDEEEPEAGAALLPFSLKQDLAKVLDKAPEGKNWRAFAIEMGINHTVCESLAGKVSPTIDVFKYCEYVESTMEDVKEALRYIGNQDAIDIFLSQYDYV